MVYKYGDSLCSNSCSDKAPDCRHAISPFFQSINVGTDCILYAEASVVFLSMSIFKMTILSFHLFFNASRMGVIILQGAHHVAKKSTRTGVSPVIIS